VGRRQHVDRQVGLLDLGRAQAGVVDVESDGVAARVIADALAREGGVQIADGDEPIFVRGVLQ